MRKLLAAVLCALAVAGCDSGDGGEAQPSRPAGDGRVADLNGGNRAAGTAGDEGSVRYVAERLREAGWRVRLEPVSFPYFDQRSPARLDGLREGEDFRTLSYSGSGRSGVAALLELATISTTWTCRSSWKWPERRPSRGAPLGRN